MNNNGLTPSARRAATALPEERGDGSAAERSGEWLAERLRETEARQAKALRALKQHGAVELSAAAVVLDDLFNTAVLAAPGSLLVATIKAAIADVGRVHALLRTLPDPDGEFPP